MRRLASARQRSLGGDGKQSYLWGRLQPSSLRAVSGRRIAAEKTHVEITPVNGLKINGNRLLSRIVIVDVAGSMRGQIGMAVLILRELLSPVVAALDVHGESRQPPTLHRGRRCPERKAQSRPAKVLAAEQTSGRYDVGTSESRRACEATVWMWHGLPMSR